jgi:hypothetical protein
MKDSDYHERRSLSEWQLDHYNHAIHEGVAIQLTTSGIHNNNHEQQQQQQQDQRSIGTIRGCCSGSSRTQAATVVQISYQQINDDNPNHKPSSSPSKDKRIVID